MVVLTPILQNTYIKCWIPGAFHSHRVTLIEAWITIYIHHKVWDEITYPFPNFNACYSEATWAVGIAQLNHNEVCERSEWCVNWTMPIANVVLLLSHTLYVQAFYFVRSPRVLQKSKRRHLVNDLFSRKSASIQLNLSLWWRLNICFEVIMAPVARAKHYKYFVFENCSQTARVYWSKNPI